MIAIFVATYMWLQYLRQNKKETACLIGLKLGIVQLMTFDVACHIETSHLIFLKNRMTGFYI